MPLRIDRYLNELRKNAGRYERIDINGNEDKSFLGRHLRKIICGVIGGVIVYFLPKGFSSDFISYASSVLSILIGLFLTAIIFSFDKFHTNLVKDLIDYDIKMKREDSGSAAKNFQVSIKEIVSPNAKQKLWDKQSHNYSKQFAYITGWNIVLCIFTIALLALSSLFDNYMSVDLSEYKFDLSHITRSSFLDFVLLSLIVLQRFFVIYWIASVMYNTLFVISSLVNFMTVKIDRSND